MFEVIAVVGGIIALFGLIVGALNTAPPSDEDIRGIAFTWLVLGLVLLIPSTVAATQLQNRQNTAFKLVRMGFINPIPTDGGDFGVSVSGVPKRVKLDVDGEKLYIIDLVGDKRKVTSPADVREIVGK